MQRCVYWFYIEWSSNGFHSNKFVMSSCFGVVTFSSLSPVKKKRCRDSWTQCPDWNWRLKCLYAKVCLLVLHRVE